MLKYTTIHINTKQFSHNSQHMLHYITMNFITSFIQSLHITPLFFTLLPFPFILISNELLDRYTHLPREVHRKYAHILSGISILVASYYLNYPEMIIFSCALITASILAVLIHPKSMFGVKRKSIGNILFAIVTLCLTLLWVPDHTNYFRFGILILTIPDALAAIFGSQFGTYLPRFGKSYLGSSVFFTSLFILTFVFTGNTLDTFFITITITTLEFFSLYGTDNLTMPLLGSFLLAFPLHTLFLT